MSTSDGSGPAGASTKAVPPEGFAVVDKEIGWTSHDVVARARGVLGTRKVGHSGTLDPGATGVLVLGVGRATKLLRFVTDMPKTYVATVRLGVETDSLDADGEITARHDMSGVTIDDVRGVLDAFRGDIEQVPPMVSAVKVGGKRLYELARKGETVERKARPVTIYDLEVGDEITNDTFTMTVTCSSGTYIRTLGADIGAALGGGASLAALRRTAVGPFTEDVAAPVEEVTVVSITDALRDFATIVVDDETTARVRNGRPVDEALATGSGPWLITGADGELVAIHERVDDRIKPAWVAV